MLFLNCLKNPAEPVKSETVLEKGKPEGKKKIRKMKLFSHRYFTHFKCLAQRICIVYVFLSVGALLIEPHLRLTSIPHCLCGIYW